MIIRVNNAPRFTVISDTSGSESDLFSSEHYQSAPEANEVLNSSPINLPRACERIQAAVPSVAGK